jgi:hypothetical protein
MSEQRSARPARRLRDARWHLGEAQRELRLVREQAQAGGDWPGQLDAALAHLRHLEDAIADAEQDLPEEPQGPSHPDRGT